MARIRLLFGVTSVFCLSVGTGCQPTAKGGSELAPNGPRGRDRIVSRVIIPPSWSDGLELEKLDALLARKAAPSAVALQARRMLSRKDPVLAFHACSHLGRGLILRPEVKAVAVTIADECLASPDVIFRWAGIWLAYDLEDDEKAAGALRDNVRSLLVRPDRAFWQYPWWLDFRRGLYGLVDYASQISDLRVRMLELFGRFRIRSAIPVLRMIIQDKGEWDAWTKVVAAASLAILEKEAETQPAGLGDSDGGRAAGIR
jgi:hypothetical protein